ncbi:hypothetical protein N308_16143, partial [Struthio camelus australis]
MGQGIAFVDGHSVGDTIPRVHDNASGAARGIKGQHSLDGHVHSWGVEGFKHDLGHLLPVGLGVKRCFSEQDRVLLRGNTQLIVEGVVPDLLHVIPVGDNTMLNGVLEGEDTPLALGLIPHVTVLLPHAHHHTLVPRAPHNGGKHSTGCIVPCKACLAH